MLQTAL